MDPILLPRLLDVVHAINQAKTKISRHFLQERLECTPRRLAEFLRVLQGTRLVEVIGENIIPTIDLDRFVAAWDVANTGTMNSILAQYQPYQRFLDCIKAERCIPIPTGNQTSAESELGARLYEKYGITFVAFDTFRRWGLILATIYVAHLGEPAVYWGGESPALGIFEDAVKESWRQWRAMDGFARIGVVAEETCRSLHISFQQFEHLFTEMLEECRDSLVVSGSALRSIEKKSEIQILIRRNDALSLAGSEGKKPQWIQKRFLEDGVLVRGQYMRLIKWRSER